MRRRTCRKRYREKNQVVTFQNVIFSYDGTPILEDLSFSIQEQTFISIVGPNAGGKTTLRKLMLDLLKPSHGVIEVFGQPPERARTRIGYMPPYVHFDPNFPLCVLDVVLMGRLGIDKGIRFGSYRKTDKAIALEALQKMEMDKARNLPFIVLSGGQRQRVLIARALATEPELLLLDEPTANVDMAVETALLKLLHTMSGTITVVVVSHDLGFVSQYVESVVCVNRRVMVHPTTAVTGEVISALFGSDVRMVRHRIKS